MKGYVLSVESDSFVATLYTTGEYLDSIDRVFSIIELRPEELPYLCEGRGFNLVTENGHDVVRFHKSEEPIQLDLFDGLTFLE